MAAPPAAAAAATVQAVLRRFTSVNGQRLQRTQEFLPREQRVFLDLLPLLFHVNDPRLPAFVSELVPCGIPYYQPGRVALKAAESLLPGFAYKRHAQPHYPIYALYLMGSSGTIAYSEKSDFDIWICHAPGLAPHQLEGLQRKAWALERWADSLGVEAHFFPVDDADFRAGRLGGLTEESSGSAQYHLLLDEFYRTGLLLAGRYPAWWLVPPEQEGLYPQAVAALLADGAVDPNEVVDFGGLGQVPPAEFYGAALWQLYKGIDSPYKSLLKILVMELYAAAFPRIDLLSLRFKQAVWQGESDVDRLDPYVMMCRAVEEYLQRGEDGERLELARRAFYFKIGERLSEPADPRDYNWRRPLLAAIVAGWEWGAEHLAHLDRRPKWKADRVMAERRALVEAFTRSYRALSDFARVNASHLAIDAADLALLGNKLHAAFERKAGKVEAINPGISSDLAEPLLSLHRSGAPLAATWLLYRGEVPTAAVASERPLKRSRSLPELLAWCHRNGLLDEQSHLRLYPRELEGTIGREVRAILKYLRAAYPGGRLGGGALTDFARPPRVLEAALFVDVAHDPLGELMERGVQLTGERQDTLCYGAHQLNLAQSCDLLLATSRRELLGYRYRGDDGLLECLCDYLAWGGGGTPLPLPQVESHSTARGPVIARRLADLIADLAGRLFDPAAGTLARYLVRVGRSLYLIERHGDRPGYRRLESPQELERRLAAPQPGFSPLYLDPAALPGSPLAALLPYNRPDVVQLFYTFRKGGGELWVADEHGSLFHQEAAYRSPQHLLAHFGRFFHAVLPRSRGSAATGELPELYLLRQAGEGWEVVRESVPPLGGGYFDLQVIGERLADGRNAFTIYCDREEFSSVEHGERLFQAVAEHLLARRRGGERYPFYITDIDIGRLVGAAEGRGEIQTIHFLNYKRRIEERLNRYLEGPG